MFDSMHGASEDATMLSPYSTLPVNLTLSSTLPAKQLPNSLSSGAQMSAAGQCTSSSALWLHHLMERRLAALQRPFLHDDTHVPKGRSWKGN